MKYIISILISVAVFSCTQPDSEKTVTVTPELEHAKFIVSMLNLGDFQDQLAQVVLFHSHDKEALTVARTISTLNLRIKDKSKVVAIPRNIETPYFLTHAQNLVVKDLKATPDSILNKKFSTLIRSNQDEMTALCEKENLSSPDAVDLMQLCAFTDSCIKQINMLLEQIQ